MQQYGALSITISKSEDYNFFVSVFFSYCLICYIKFKIVFCLFIYIFVTKIFEPRHATKFPNKFLAWRPTIVCISMETHALFTWKLREFVKDQGSISFFFRHQIWFKISLEKILVSLLQDIMHTTIFALAMYFPKFSHFLQRTSFGM